MTVKRLFDFFVSLLSLIILSPLFLLIIILIKFDSKGPILFKQKRFMKNKSFFYILKFRTMKIETPKDMPTHLLENPEQWITNIGKILRKTSLDELPQIINILKGEMSIVGPRPALWNQIDLIEERDKYGANDIPVGLTGWAQINGRDELPIEVKAKFDGEYVKKMCFMFDLKCILLTFMNVIRQKGIVEGNKKINETKKKHILVVSQYFYPEQFRINDICKEWVNRGYKVTVLCGIPNYPQGKYHKGYGILKKRKEKYEGINIIRIPIIPRGSNSIMLFFNYISFVISGYIWKILTTIKADFVFVFSLSPMSLALPGVWYSKKMKIPMYIYIQDLWPESVLSTTNIRNTYVIANIEKMVDYIYKNSKKIFTTSNAFIDSIKKRGIDQNKLIYWPQYAEEFYQPLLFKEVKEIPNDDYFNIIFTGNIGYAQGLDILIEVANIVKERSVKKIRFNLVGDGRYKNELINEVKGHGLENYFNFVPRQDATRIPELIAACDVAFLSLSDHLLFSMTIPAKLQSYMACGIAVLASASGETKNIIERSKSGICTNPGNAEALVDSIIEMSKLSEEQLNLFGSNARKFYEDNFDKNYLLNQMDEYLNH